MVWSLTINSSWTGYPERRISYLKSRYTFHLDSQSCVLETPTFMLYHACSYEQHTHSYYDMQYPGFVSFIPGCDPRLCLHRFLSLRRDARGGHIHGMGGRKRKGGGTCEWRINLVLLKLELRLCLFMSLNICRNRGAVSNITAWQRYCYGHQKSYESSLYRTVTPCPTAPPCSTPPRITPSWEGTRTELTRWSDSAGNGTRVITNM